MIRLVRSQSANDHLNIEGNQMTNQPTIIVNGQRATINYNQTVNATLESLWFLVDNFNNVSQWHPDVVDSTIEKGTGFEAGSIRQIHLKNGTPLREELRSISKATHSYTYSVIEAPLPLTNHESTLTMTSQSPTHTVIQWSAVFDAVEIDPRMLAEGVLEGVIKAGISGLEKHANAHSK
jgi:hypothetical protein